MYVCMYVCVWLIQLTVWNESLRYAVGKVCLCKNVVWALVKNYCPTVEFFRPWRVFLLYCRVCVGGERNSNVTYLQQRVKFDFWSFGMGSQGSSGEDKSGQSAVGVRKGPLHPHPLVAPFWNISCTRPEAVLWKSYYFSYILSPLQCHRFASVGVSREKSPQTEREENA